MFERGRIGMEIDRRKRLPSLMIYARFHAYERAA